MIRIWLVTVLVSAALGCQSGTAVRRVWSTKHLEQVEPVDQEYFLTDRASRIRTASKQLPAEDQGEEFFVVWSGREVELVQFEYRQVNSPERITAQDFRTGNRCATTFWVRGEGYRRDGAVSAWRVTLWKNGQLLAEKHSLLW